MPTDNALYLEALAFPKSALGKRILEILTKDRAEKIESLIYYGSRSHDKVVSAIARSLEIDSPLLAEIRAIREEFEPTQPPKGETPEKPSQYPNYEDVTVAGLREMEYTP